MIKFKAVVTKILEIICIILFGFITLVGTYQIVTRYVFNAPSTISEELLTFSFTWMALLSAALVFGKREHMRMEFFVDRFKESTQLYISIGSEILVMLFSIIVLIYGGYQITKLTMIQITASLGVPMAYVYIIIPITGVIISIFNILNINQLLLELKNLNSKGGI